MRKHHAGWIVILALCSTAAVATSVVAIRRSNELIVGTDSLFLSTGTPVLGCKIRHDNGVYIAAAGLATNPATLFDAYRLALPVRHRRTVADSSRAFMLIAKPHLERALENIRTDYPEFFKSKISPMAEPLGVLFFGFDGKVPRFVYVYFNVPNYFARHIKTRMRYNSCPESACPFGESVKLFGERRAAQQAFMVTPREIDDVETIRRMIEAQKAATPDRVNGPVEIIDIDSKGFHWPQNKLNCQ